MDSIADFLKLLGLLTAGGLIVLGAVVYLIKHVVKRWIDRAFTAKEKEIDHQNKLLEHRAQVVFSTLHEKRANAIETIYAKFLEFKDAVLEVVNKGHIDDKQGEERFKRMWELGHEVHRLVERLGIYLDKKTCDMILNLTNEYDQAGFTVQVGSGVPVPLQDYYPKLERAREKLKQCILLFDEVKDQFRRIFGVE
jgi:hypothetical protein